MAASSSTTPGTMGVPGKWPAKAGWSGAMWSFVSLRMGRPLACVRLRQRLERFARQLAVAVAGQCVEQHDRPRQEDRVDALAQRGKDRGGLHAGCHDESH